LWDFNGLRPGWQGRAGDALFPAVNRRFDGAVHYPTIASAGFRFAAGEECEAGGKDDEENENQNQPFQFPEFYHVYHLLDDLG
jgi:hypothetical protein